MRKIFLILTFIVSVYQAQKLEGFVYELSNSEKIPLPGVNIIWLGTGIGTASGIDGKFEIIRTTADSARLLLSHVAYKPDTLIIGKDDSYIEVSFRKTRVFEEITVTARTKGINIKEYDPIFTQSLNRKELSKAACCNLSESFETNASVDVSYADAVTGAKKIRLLGLDGKYSQIMMENIPNIRGLASAYGLYYVPGPWMESIQISKGAASVINGFESITGQINIEYIKPTTENKLYADLYMNRNLRSDMNIIAASNISENLSSALLVHGSYFGNNVDDNKDNFLDHPNSRQFNIINRWKYNSEHLHAQLGINYMLEERKGGQAGFGSSLEELPYKTSISTSRLQIWSKTGYIFGNESNGSLGFINMVTLHDQEARFGLRDFNADQFTYYSNLIFETDIFNAGHKINTGISISYDSYSESFDSLNDNPNQTVPGFFFQYTYSPTDKLVIIGGIRSDFLSGGHPFYTPRIHARYSPWENTTIRVTAGKGYRNSWLIAENIRLLSSSRKFYKSGSIKIEEAVNTGINLTQYFSLMNRELSITAEYYRTSFINKVVADIDRNSREVHFYNLEGDSFSDNYQVELSYELFPRLDILAAFRYSDAKTTYSGELLSDPFNKKIRSIISFSYITKLRLWQFDFTANYNGKSRLPRFTNSAIREYSPEFVIINTQVTRYYKNFEVYLGIENITDFRQDSPVITPDDPFGPDFDASIIWGPLSGRNIYLGIRYSIK